MIGKKLDLMPYAVSPVDMDSLEVEYIYSSEFKVITFGDVYCDPCWENVIQWNQYYKDFEMLSNVSVFCYVYSSIEDYNLKTNDERIEVSIFIDPKNRVSIVNKIPKNPENQTYLLNHDNEIKLVGNPFNVEMKAKYMEIILKSE